MRMAIGIAIGVGIAAGLAGLAVVSFIVLSDNENQEVVTEVVTPAAGGPRLLEVPERVTAGDWQPPAMTEQAQAEGEAAWLRAAEGPFFDGEIGGFRIGEQVSFRYHCPGAEARLALPELYPLKLGYLPPNTFETYEPYVALCPDDRFYSAMRLFRLGSESSDTGMFGDATLSVMLIGSEPALSEAFPQHLVDTAMITGRTAVVVRPYTTAGWGESRVIVPIDGSTGYIMVLAYNVPFDEVLKVAEEVSCESC